MQAKSSIVISSSSGEEENGHDNQVGHSSMHNVYIYTCTMYVGN